VGYPLQLPLQGGGKERRFHLKRLSPILEQIVFMLNHCVVKYECVNLLVFNV